jgi:hypothetical protein
MSVPESTWIFSLAGKLFLTTREAAAYCGFKTTSALRKAKLEGRIAPVSRRGGRGTLMSCRDSLDGGMGLPAATRIPLGRARPDSRKPGGQQLLTTPSGQLLTTCPKRASEGQCFQRRCSTRREWLPARALRKGRR